MLFDRLRLLIVSVGLLTSLVVVVGCRKNSETDNTTVVTTGQNGGETQAETCRKKLAAAIRRLEPERLALQSNPERSINGLNAWIASCVATEVEALKLSEGARALLSSNPRATARRYTGADANYVRDTMMLRDLTAALSARQTGDDESAGERDRTRVLRSFEWVVRNISLLPPGEQRPPLGLFDVMLTGQGTPEDRAWILAEVLRQQQIDAVVVSTAAEPQPEGEVLETATWIVAVIQNDAGMLFDMATGLPLTVDGKLNLLQPAPAALTVLKEHDRWKDSTVQVIAQVAAFAPRMLVLQDQLAAEDSAVLFEELTGGVSEIRPLVDRVVAGGGGDWTKEDVSVWPYPEQQVIASNSLSEEQQREYAAIMRPFDAPFERKIYQTESVEELTTVPEALPEEERRRLAQERLLENFIRMTKSSEEMFGTPSRRLLKARIQQILGSTDTAVIQQLQQIRISGMEEVIQINVPIEVQKEFGLPPVRSYPLPKIIRQVNQSSTGDSLYWTALCQIDRDEVGAAITTLVNYRRQYPDGQWKYPSLINQSLALLTQGRIKDATVALQEADAEDNPERRRVQLMLRALPAG